MQPVTLYRKISGAPVQVGISQGNLYAFMIGTQRVSVSGEIVERPVVFVAPKPMQIPSSDQWIAVAHLIRFSQPNAWSFDEMAINQIMTSQLIDA